MSWFRCVSRVAGGSSSRSASAKNRLRFRSKNKLPRRIPAELPIKKSDYHPINRPAEVSGPGCEDKTPITELEVKWNYWCYQTLLSFLIIEFVTHSVGVKKARPPNSDGQIAALLPLFRLSWGPHFVLQRLLNKRPNRSRAMCSNSDKKHKQIWRADAFVNIQRTPIACTLWGAIH